MSIRWIIIAIFGGRGKTALFAVFLIISKYAGINYRYEDWDYGKMNDDHAAT